MYESSIDDWLLITKLKLEMNIKEIRQLLEKYEAAETSRDEERRLAAYFAGRNIPEEFQPYAAMFRRFAEERQTVANSDLTGKLRAAQRSARKRRLRRALYVSIGIAASFLILISTGVFHGNSMGDAQFIMYSNGKRIKDPAIAMEFTKKELNSILAVIDRANLAVAKPVNVIHNSLEPLRKMRKSFETLEKTQEKSENK